MGGGVKTCPNCGGKFHTWDRNEAGARRCPFCHTIKTQFKEKRGEE